MALLTAVGVWAFLLRGFVSAATLVALCLAGPLLVSAGIAVARRVDARAVGPAWTLGRLVIALALVAAGLLTLAAGAPDRLLVTTARGWDLLDGRAARLDAAIAADDVALARRLAGRGLGDAVPRDSSGRPLLHEVERPAMLAALLAEGLDPDARDEDGQTRLMLVQQPELARMLLDAGADVHARDRLGRSVADHHLPYGDIRPLIDARAGGAQRESAQGGPETRGRSDWLLVEPPAATASSAVLVPAAPDRGAEATATTIVVNPSDGDRLIDVRAELNEAVLFVAASHGGAVEQPGRPQVVQTIRWPLLTLPAHRAGRLTLGVVRRADGEAGDPAIRWHIRQVPQGETDTIETVAPRDARAAGGAPPGPGTPEAIWPRVWWLAVLVPLGLLLAALSRWRRPGSDRVPAAGRAVALGGAVVSAGIALALTWSAVEPFVRLQAASCTILDRRVFSREIVVRSPGSTTSTPTRSYAVPVVAVRVEAGATPIVATGFSLGMATRGVHELRPFALGARVPCWVDPAVASRFTLVRWPPLSLAAGLVMLGLTTAMLLLVARWHSGPPAPRPPRRRPRADS